MQTVLPERRMPKGANQWASGGKDNRVTALLLDGIVLYTIRLYQHSGLFTLRLTSKPAAGRKLAGVFCQDLKLDGSLSRTWIPEADNECGSCFKGLVGVPPQLGGHSKSHNLVPGLLAARGRALKGEGPPRMSRGNTK